MAHRNSYTTDFIVDSEDYFAAFTDNGEIRFGLVGVTSYQIGMEHEAAESVKACKNSDDVEAIFDDFVSGVYDGFKYEITG